MKVQVTLAAKTKHKVLAGFKSATLTPEERAGFLKKLKLPGWFPIKPFGVPSLGTDKTHNQSFEDTVAKLTKLGFKLSKAIQKNGDRTFVRDDAALNYNKGSSSRKPQLRVAKLRVS